MPGCAFVEFESSPYSPSELDVVHSAQEDMTFLSWRLDRRADPGAVEFELVSDDGYRVIDLAAAPFPAAPYRCGSAWCFQFQLDGRVDFAEDVPILRARHPRYGMFASLEPSTHEVDTTFDVDPLGVERNARIDPRRFDWFAEAGVPLVREYGFRLQPGACEPDGAAELADFVRSDGLVAARTGWTDGEACFEAMPVHREGNGTVVRRPIVPSAETYLAQRETHTVPNQAHRTLYGVLFDLSIADSARCEAVRAQLTDTLRAEIEGRDPGAVWLGAFEPDDAPDCAARPPELYPVAAMLQAAFDAAAVTAGPARTVFWLHVSNRATSGPVLEEALAQLLAASAELEPNPAFLWSLAVTGSATSRWVTSYRPIEDETLLDDIDTVAEQAVPFRTMLHDASDEIPIAAASGAPTRAEAKLCQAIPPAATVVLAGGTASLGQAFAWPADDAVAYRVELGEQIGVPNQEYVPTSVTVLMEVCARFCGGPVRTANGTVLPSWRDSTECAGIP